MQNQINLFLEKHPIIPVVTLNGPEDIDRIYRQLMDANISCVEITLRTPYAVNGIQTFKEKYGESISIGVGTIINIDQIRACIETKVDFMVTPGLSSLLLQHLEHSAIPYLPGVATPGEIVKGLELGCSYFKFFPANLFGGIDALKTYASVFSQAKFCPTGGLTASNYTSYLELPNVVSVGGSWIVK